MMITLSDDHFSSNELVVLLRTQQQLPVCNRECVRVCVSVLVCVAIVNHTNTQRHTLVQWKTKVKFSHSEKLPILKKEMKVNCSKFNFLMDPKP